MSKDSPIENHGIAIEAIGSESEYLLHLAKSLKVVGLKDLADDLIGVSKQIEISKDEAKSAFDKMFDDWFRATQEGSSNLIKLAIAISEKG